MMVPYEQSSSTHDYIHDVFLSFRGVDTRLNFTNHLHQALVNANITTFLDDEDIETGEDLKPTLKRAIKASRASIIVISKNYASSTWCLDELVLILKQSRRFNHIVIPIFYHVEPSDVKRQQNSFGIAMENHNHRMELETNAEKKSQWAKKMEQWKQALTEVGLLKGENAEGRKEAEFVQEIVSKIHHRLGVPLKITLPFLTGMKGHIKFISLWLKDGSSDAIDILTILGMTGIGKTSLAKYVFGLHCRIFQRSIFIENIGRKCTADRCAGLGILQKELCVDISKTSSIRVQNDLVCASRIENIIAQEKVLLVLDDVDSLDQLNVLLGNTSFHPGSKIIITTNDKSLTPQCALFKRTVKPKHIQLLLEGLDENASLELLSSHAFMCNNPNEGYEEVSRKLVEYCEGLPLALTVLGKSLHNRKVAEWEDCIKVLKKETNSRIREDLQRSFDSLPYENDKKLFKYIACFFVEEHRESTRAILNACEISTVLGFRNLIDRCLLKIGGDNKLLMHHLLKKMGREVVRQESHKPWKRSLLWCHEESFKVLKQMKGKGTLLGLALDMEILGKDELHRSFELQALSKMENLMLIQLNHVQLNGSYENFPKELRWLCMHDFPLEYIPPALSMKNLVALDMSHSKFEYFDMSYSDPQQLEKRQKIMHPGSKDKRLLGKLKVLNLSSCKQLRSLSGFSEIPALERLILAKCTGLTKVCESIEECDKLVLIDLSYCNEFRKLTWTMGKLKNLETLLLDGCNLGEFPSETKDMNLPEMPEANNIEEAIPRDFRSIVVSLPSSLACLSLKHTNLSIESFPMDFSSLSMLKELYLDGNSIISLPNCVRSLPRLEKLSMEKCFMLKTFVHPPSTLKDLIFDKWHSLQKIVFDEEKSPLTFSMNPWCTAYPRCYVIKGMLKVEAMAHVPDEVLRGLGWTNLEFIEKRQMQTCHLKKFHQNFEVQMVYEFGIFSTTYGGKEVPNWISHRSNDSSISFTIPSSPNNLTGLNFCYVFMAGHPYYLYLPRIRISNITKDRTWIYDRYSYHAMPDEECEILLSHWMFGKNEMEDGDQVTITIIKRDPPAISIRECGVKLVYGDGKIEKKDPLGDYKSWNHIIGGDLSAFRTTTEEYLLDGKRFFCGTGFSGCERYAEHKFEFRAFSKEGSM